MKRLMKTRWLLNSTFAKFRFSSRNLFDLLYKTCKVGQFIPDLMAFDAVIVDTKTIDRITDFEHGQMLNYLRITKLRVGVL
jgi:GxxExxY protein